MPLVRVPVDGGFRADPGALAAAVTDRTAVVVGSAPGFPHGVIDPIPEIAALAADRGVGCHVDACLGGFILPFGQELGFDVPVFDYRLPGVTSISADTHKYGYALKGTSVLTFRDPALRNAQYFTLTDWSGGKYCSPGMEGSRSGGLIAATWAAMVQLGREGYRRDAAAIFQTSSAMQDAVRSHPELRLLGRPTFLFSFTSDEFDVYHVNDFLRRRGWRLNGQQYPNALHMAVTGPQTRDGVAAAWAGDLAGAVDYAKAHRDEAPASGAIYGGVAGGMTDEADSFIRAVMAEMMDDQQAVPADWRPSQA
ncbi:MAG TPA: pyridoxal-dependent decarboxylase, partial [Acidimicrobiales bacterium]